MRTARRPVITATLAAAAATILAGIVAACPAAGVRYPAWSADPVPAAPLATRVAVAAAVTNAAGPRVAITGTAAGFVSPVSGPLRVVTPFRPPPHRYGSGHRGVDLAAAAGDPVFTAGPGTVAYAGLVAGRGVVSIEHSGGLRTTYEPVEALVAAGDTVMAGQRIGTLRAGHASCAPASCLHWGARLPDRVYLDPMALLDRWHVRLKPWSAD